MKPDPTGARYDAEVEAIDNSIIALLLCEHYWGDHLDSEDENCPECQKEMESR